MWKSQSTTYRRKLYLEILQYRSLSWCKLEQNMCSHFEYKEVILFSFEFISQTFQETALEYQINADLRQQRRVSSSYFLLTTDLYTWINYRISQHIFSA